MKHPRFTRAVKAAAIAEPAKREWTRSKTLALAAQGCAQCLGFGLRPSGGAPVCGCVLRAIFRACYTKFRACANTEARLAESHFEAALTAANHHKASTKTRKYGYPKAEFCADFLAIARRAFADDLLHAEIFKWHYLYGADFKLVNRKLGRALDDRETFHNFYRVEERLGRAFAETAPYGLWPIDEYFGVTKGRVRKPEAAESHASAFPLKAAA